MERNRPCSIPGTGSVRKLKRDLMATYEALHYKEKEILDVEAVQREKLKYRKH